MPSFADNLRGIVMMTTTVFVFILNDALIKLASAALPVGEIMVIRGGLASIAIIVYVVLSGAIRQWRALLTWLVLWRTVGEIGATVLYLLALFHMPIGNITAIDQVAPLMITAGAAIFLGENVTWRQWMAVAIGFGGVLIIVRPGVGGFDIYALTALGAMLFVTLRDLVTRRFTTRVPTLLVTAVTAPAITATGACVSLWETWIAPNGAQWAMLGIASVLLVVGYATAIAAMRFGSMAVVAPFRYLAIVFALVLGYLIWDDVPDMTMLIGTVIVVATGVYTFYTERRDALAAAAPAPAGSRA